MERMLEVKRNKENALKMPIDDVSRQVTRACSNLCEEETTSRLENGNNSDERDASLEDAEKETDERKEQERNEKTANKKAIEEEQIDEHEETISQLRKRNAEFREKKFKSFSVDGIYY